jgi:hypothetical protein
MKFKFVISVLICAGMLVFAASAFAMDLTDVQKALKASGALWTAGATSVSDFSADRMRNYLTLDLTLPDDWEGYLNNSLNYPERADLPEALDWRDIDGRDFSTPIRNQDPCGTCQTFCFMAATEALLKINQDNPFIQPDLSEQHVYSCDGPIPYTLFHPAIYMTSNGASDESCMPYDCHEGYRASCDGKCADWQERSLKISEWKMYMFPDPETLKGLLQYGPIVAGFQVFEDFQYYTGGVYEHQTGGILGGHGVAVFGYGVDDVGGYWICKNSWGTSWGEDGWFKIRWGSGLLGFGYQSMSITVTDESLCGANAEPSISNLTLRNDSDVIPEQEAPRIIFDYADANANLAGGELLYKYDDGAEQRYETALTGCVDVDSSGRDLNEYTLAVPADAGTHTLSVWLRDTCGAQSNVETLSFAYGQAADDDTTSDDVSDDTGADDDAAPATTGGDDDDDDDGGCGC